MKLLKPIISPQIYFPGLISLVFLPWLCICYLFEQGELTQQYQMRVYYTNKKLIDYWAKINHTTPIYPGTFRHYKKIILSGNEKQNGLCLKYVSNQLKRIKDNVDTVNGYQIQFSDKTKYADVVKTFDLLYSRDNNGMIYGDNVYFFWTKPPSLPKDTSAIDRRPLVYDDVVIKKPELTLFEKFEKMLGLTAPFWPCLIPFWGMIYFWRKSRIVNNRGHYQVNL